MDGVFGDRVLRCSDGHLFVAGETARLFGSIHLGPKRLMRCPVDGKFRVMSNANTRALSPAELEQARAYHT